MHSEDEKKYTEDGNSHGIAASSQGHELEDKDKAKKKQKKGEKPKVVSPFTLFRYSSWSDKLLMILGTLLAIAHGSSLPFAMIIFGDMTDSFVSSGDKNPTGDFSQNFTSDMLHKLEEDMTRNVCQQVK